MKQRKSRDNFWFTLAFINILAVVYPASSYLQADSMEDRILAICMLIGAGLILAIIDTVSIAVTYSQ